MSETLEATDRYGGNYPDPKTVCPGQCEGMGHVPINETDMSEPWRSLWLETEKENPTEPGDLSPSRYHFVKCPECNGTGKIA